MKFDVTNDLLDFLSPYTENAEISICTENKDWKGEDYLSDLVTIDAENNVGFEVFDKEIIVFYFTEHCHFEDYSSEPGDGEDDYIKRAKDFLSALFTNSIKYVEKYRGKKLALEKYFMLYSDNTEEYIGGTWWGLARLINPFARKAEKTSIYKFDEAKACFEKS